MTLKFLNRIAHQLKQTFKILGVTSCLILPMQLHAQEAIQNYPTWRNFPSQVKDSYRNFYKKQNGILLGLGFGMGALMANTSIDQSIADWYQKQVRSTTTNCLSTNFKVFGNNKDVLIGFAAIAGASLALHQTQPGRYMGKFSQRYLAGLLVGLPPLLITQNLTGADRPYNHNGSHWQPLKHDHGVSGHAFLGALPFLTLSNMTNQPILKSGLVLTSTLTGLSRINDNAHYASQVGLGWLIAYLSARSVAYNSSSSVEITPFVDEEGTTGLGVSKSF